MAFMYDYILRLDVGRLSAGEVSQCLLYLYHLSKHDPEIEASSAGIKAELQARLTELRKGIGKA